MAEPQLYLYSRLKTSTSIRIIQLHHGTREKSLCCTVDVVDLASKPSFMALSYVWGNAEKPFRIYVGNDKYIPLTTSLHSLLCDMRDRRVELPLWADQICIDQQNIPE
jgi:hypothetical protein